MVAPCLSWRERDTRMKVFVDTAAPKQLKVEQIKAEPIKVAEIMAGVGRLLPR